MKESMCSIHIEACISRPGRDRKKLCSSLLEREEWVVICFIK